MSVSETVKNGFVTGVFLIAPLAVSIFVVQLVYGWLVGIVGPAVSIVPGVTTPLAEPLALVVLLVAVTLLGIVVRHGIGDEIVRRFDHLMEAIPGVSVIYSSVRQASTALRSHEDRFERVVLVHLPQSGLRTVGFVTAETPSTLRESFPEEDRDESHYDVFVPMAPNPMGGFVVVVPESRLTMTDLSVRKGLQLVVTTGMTGEEDFSTEEFTASS